MNKFEKVTFYQYSNLMKGDYDLKPEWEAIKLPQRATAGSAGYDFFAPFDIDLAPGEVITIPTGIRVVLDEDKYLMIVPRSGMGFRYQIRLANTTGIIDSDYFMSDNGGHIMMKLINGDTPVHIKAGQGIAQGIINKYYQTDDDGANKARNGGFGSTDNV